VRLQSATEPSACGPKCFRTWESQSPGQIDEVFVDHLPSLFVESSARPCAGQTPAPERILPFLHLFKDGMFVLDILPTFPKNDRVSCISPLSLTSFDLELVRPPLSPFPHVYPASPAGLFIKLTPRSFLRLLLTRAAHAVRYLLWSTTTPQFCTAVAHLSRLLARFPSHAIVVESSQPGPLFFREVDASFIRERGAKCRLTVSFFPEATVYFPENSFHSSRMSTLRVLIF